MLIIGIDPGANGGIAIIPLYAFHRTRTFALANYELVDISNMFSEIRHGSPDTEDPEYRCDTQVEVFLEEPQLPMFNKHTGGNFNVQAHKKLARSIGQMEGICIAHNWTVNTLSPQKWQNALKCRTGGDKNVTKNLAELVFPFLTKISATGKVSSNITHAIADALLIALYGYLQYATMIPNSVKHNLDGPLLERKRNESSTNGLVPTDGTGPRSSTRTNTVPTVTRPPRRLPPKRQSDTI